MSLYQQRGTRVVAVHEGTEIHQCECRSEDLAERIVRLLNEDDDREDRRGGWVWVIVGFAVCAALLFAALVWTEVI